MVGMPRCLGDHRSGRIDARAEDNHGQNKSRDEEYSEGNNQRQIRQRVDEGTSDGFEEIQQALPKGLQLQARKSREETAQDDEVDRFEGSLSSRLRNSQRITRPI